MQAFSRLCDRDSLFIVTRKPRSVGTRTGFLLTLANGEPMLAGEGEVVEAYRTKDNRYGRPGMKLRLRALEDDSRAVLQRLLTAHAQSLIPEPPLPTHLRQARVGTVPPRSAQLGGPVGRVGPLTGRKLTDSAAQAMAECVLYDEPSASEPAAAPYAEALPVPHVPPPAPPPAAPHLRARPAPAPPVNAARPAPGPLHTRPPGRPPGVPYAPVTAPQAPAAPYPPAQRHPAQQEPYRPVDGLLSGPPGNMPARSVGAPGHPRPMPPALPPSGQPGARPVRPMTKATEVVALPPWGAAGHDAGAPSPAFAAHAGRRGVSRRNPGRVAIGAVALGSLVAFAIWGNSTPRPPTAGASGVPGAARNAPRSAPRALASDAAGPPTAAAPAGPGQPAAPPGELTAAVPSKPVCSVHIDSAPQGATVRLGERELGETPLETTLPCGDVELELHRSRRLPATRSAALTPDGDNRIFTELERPMTTLTITSTPSGAAVTVNGEPAGETPASIQRAAYRTVDLVVSKTGYRPHKQQVQLEPPRTPVRVTLERARTGTRRGRR